MYKVLCVDDEWNVLQYLPVAIDWEQLGVEEIRTASNGREALQVLDEFDPDIAIVDVEMPDMNGLEFCRRASEIRPELRMVILSAFDRFDYAKQAIGIGVEDYILKPIDEEELERVMKKIMANIEKSRKDSRDREQLTSRALEKELKELTNCFAQNTKYKTDLETSFQFLKKYQNFCIAVQDVRCAKDRIEEVEERPHSDELFLVMERGIIGIFWKKDDGASMYEQLQRFRKRAEAKGLDLRFYYTRKREEESLSQTIERCFGAMEAAFYRRDRDIEADAGEPYFLNLELQPPELKEAMNVLSEEGDISLLAETILGEVERAFERHVQPRAICQMVLDVFITLKIYLTECWQEESLGVFRKMNLWDFLCCGSQEILRGMLEEKLKELQRFITRQREEHGNLYIVKRAKSYTKEHYQNIGLTLQEVADAAGISRTYFSSTFKELTGEKYWDYLSRYRIEKAKTLLKETGLSQAEISEKVGYNSEYHFSRKFKEIVGISPNKFRKK